MADKVVGWVLGQVVEDNAGLLLSSGAVGGHVGDVVVAAANHWLQHVSADDGPGSRVADRVHGVDKWGLTVHVGVVGEKEALVVVVARKRQAACESVLVFVEGLVEEIVQGLVVIITIEAVLVVNIAQRSKVESFEGFVLVGDVHDDLKTGVDVAELVELSQNSVMVVLDLKADSNVDGNVLGVGEEGLEEGTAVSTASDLHLHEPDALVTFADVRPVAEAAESIDGDVVEVGFPVGVLLVEVVEALVDEQNLISVSVFAVEYIDTNVGEHGLQFGDLDGGEGSVVQESVEQQARLTVQDQQLLGEGRFDLVLGFNTHQIAEKAESFDLLVLEDGFHFTVLFAELLQRADDESELVVVTVRLDFQNFDLDFHDPLNVDFVVGGALQRDAHVEEIVHQCAWASDNFGFFV